MRLQLLKLPVFQHIRSVLQSDSRQPGKPGNSKLFSSPGKLLKFIDQDLNKKHCKYTM